MRLKTQGVSTANVFPFFKPIHVSKYYPFYLYIFIFNAFKNCMFLQSKSNSNYKLSYNMYSNIVFLVIFINVSIIGNKSSSQRHKERRCNATNHRN